MINRVSENVADLTGLQLQQSLGVNQTSSVAANAQAKVNEALDNIWLDQASISNEALQKLEKEQSAQKYARLAQSLDQPVNPKVDELKNLYQHGQIQSYLRQFDDSYLAELLTPTLQVLSR